MAADGLVPRGSRALGVECFTLWSYYNMVNFLHSIKKTDTPYITVMPHGIHGFLNHKHRKCLFNSFFWQTMKTSKPWITSQSCGKYYHAIAHTLIWILTHYGRMTHICIGKLTNMGSDNGLSPGRRQAIIWTNAGILLIGPLGTNFSEILIEIQTFSLKKIRLKMLSAKWFISPEALASWLLSCRQYHSKV